jgi:hypothetical protein
MPDGNKIYQSTVNRPNVHKIYQHLPLQEPPKFTQIGISGLKINHLATLSATSPKQSKPQSFFATDTFYIIYFFLQS